LNALLIVVYKARVSEVDSHFDDVFPAHPICFEAGEQIEEGLFCLLLDACRNVAFTVTSDLTGDHQPFGIARTFTVWWYLPTGA
jgi:hypothetical protein